MPKSKRSPQITSKLFFPPPTKPNTITHPAIPSKFIERLIYLINHGQKNSLHKKTDEQIRNEAMDILNEAHENGEAEETLQKITWEYRITMQTEKNEQ